MQGASLRGATCLGALPEAARRRQQHTTTKKEARKRRDDSGGGIRLCGDGVDIAVETAGRLDGSICGEVNELTLDLGAFVIARAWVHAVRDEEVEEHAVHVPLPLVPCRIESLRTRTTQSHVLSFSIPTSQPSKMPKATILKISFLDLDEAGARQWVEDNPDLINAFMKTKRRFCMS